MNDGFLGQEGKGFASLSKDNGMGFFSYSV